MKDIKIQRQLVKEIQYENQYNQIADQFYENHQNKRIQNCLRIWILYKEESKYNNERYLYIKNFNDKRIILKIFKKWINVIKLIRIYKKNINYMNKKIIFRNWRKYVQSFNIDPVIESRQIKIALKHYKKKIFRKWHISAKESHLIKQKLTKEIFKRWKLYVDNKRINKNKIMRYKDEKKIRDKRRTIKKFKYLHLLYKYKKYLTLKADSHFRDIKLNKSINIWKEYYSERIKYKNDLKISTKVYYYMLYIEYNTIKKEIMF